MKLYSYYRSSAAYRVRIALNLKGLDYDYVAVQMLEKEQKGSAYLGRNPQGLIPALELESGEILAQTTAIIEWLEESYPTPALLPQDGLARARIRSLAQNIACDIHPLNNIAILNYLKDELAADEAAVHAWYTTWIQRGFDAVEKTVSEYGGDFCFGQSPTMADCYLVPQVFNADRFNIETSQYPCIRRIYEHCCSQEAFARAAPAVQPDAVDA